LEGRYLKQFCRLLMSCKKRISCTKNGALYMAHQIMYLQYGVDTCLRRYDNRGAGMTTEGQV